MSVINHTHILEILKMKSEDKATMPKNQTVNILTRLFATLKPSEKATALNWILEHDKTELWLHDHDPNDPHKTRFSI